MLRHIKAGETQILYHWDGDDTAFPVRLINRGRTEVMVHFSVQGDLFGPSILVVEVGALRSE